MAIVLVGTDREVGFARADEEHDHVVVRARVVRAEHARRAFGGEHDADALVVLELETDQPLVPKGFEGRCAEASGAKRYGCAERGLQEWVRENAWKRRGLLGRIGLFVPLE